MQQNESFSIGVLAARSGLSIATIRYYEQIGLIPPPRRRESGHRVYGTQQEAALGQVKALRDMGFPLEKVRQAVTALSEGADGAEFLRAMAAQQLAEVQVRLSELSVFAQRLQAVVATCSSECPSGPASKCSIMRDMTQGGCGSGVADSRRRLDPQPT